MRSQIRAFSENINNLRDFVELVSSYLEEKSSEEFKDNAHNLAPLLLAMHTLNPEEFKLDEEKIPELQKKFGSKIQIIVNDNEQEKKKSVSFKFEGDGEKRFGEAVNIFNAKEQRLTALYCNSLISLISTVEWFIAQIIHMHYKKYPGIVSAKGWKFTLEELSDFETINDARNFIIEKEIESVLRGSLKDWLSFFRNTLKLDMNELNKHEMYLIEAAQRRNLLVHNGGIVNHIYLSNYSSELGKAPEIGDKLNVSFEYLTETISRFESCFLLIVAEMWKKVGKDDEDRGTILTNIAFIHLLEERYGVAESLSLFVASDNSLKEIDRLYSKVNYWIAKKFGGGFDDVKQEIESEDFSAKSRLLILAKNILLDKNEDAYKDIEFLIENDKDFTCECVKNWPLFKGFREHQLYQEFCEKYCVRIENHKNNTEENEV